MKISNHSKEFVFPYIYSFTCKIVFVRVPSSTMLWWFQHACCVYIYCRIILLGILYSIWYEVFIKKAGKKAWLHAPYCCMLNIRILVVMGSVLFFGHPFKSFYRQLWTNEFYWPTKRDELYRPSFLITF
jgi:hypothetical protein